MSTTGRVHSSRQRPLPPAHALRVEPDYSTIASNSSWSGRAVDILAEHGVAVVQGAVPKSTCDALLKQIEEWPATAEGTSGTTRQPHRRRHQALPMRHNASGAAVHALMETLGDTLRQALGSADQSGVRVVECGFLTSEPGAQAQAFHAIHCTRKATRVRGENAQGAARSRRRDRGYGAFGGGTRQSRGRL